METTEKGRAALADGARTYRGKVYASRIVTDPPATRNRSAASPWSTVCRRLFGGTPGALKFISELAEENSAPVRWRTCDSAPRDIDPAVIDMLNSDDAVVRARAEAEIDRSISAVEDGPDIPIVGNAHPLIPDGVYSARFDHHETGCPFGSPKIFLWFVLTGGELDGVRICLALPVLSLIGPPGRSGKFRLSGGQRLFAILRGINGAARADRSNLRAMRGRPLLVETRTVKVDRNRKPLPKWRYYSMVADVWVSDDG